MRHRDFPFSFARRIFVHLADAFPVALAVFPRVGALRLGAVEGTAIAIWRHDFVGLEKQAGVGFVEQINVAERDRAHGVAMIRAIKRKKFWLNGSRGRSPHQPAARSPREFIGQFQRDFQRRRAVVGEKNLLQFTMDDLRLTRQFAFRNRKSQIVHRKFGSRLRPVFWPAGLPVHSPDRARTSARFF